MRRVVALAGALAIGLAAATARAEAEDIASPRGETVRILVEKTANPWVTVVLFAGGLGNIDLSKTGDIGNLKGNFLNRSRAHFQSAGAVTVVIDAPSDRSNFSGFRATESHARDIGAVIRHLRSTLKLPVWVIGTSNGTTSAANAGARLAVAPERPDGVVLTATRLQTTRHAESVLDLGADKIAGPVLLVHHRNDNCGVTPPDKVPDLRVALTAAAPAKVLWYDGGGRTRGDVCGAYHYHGFVGIEAQVVADNMAWIGNPTE